MNRRTKAPGAGDRGLGEDPLLGLGQLVRAVAALHPQVVATEGELVGGQQLLGLLVGDLVPLELEEQERRLDRRRALADLLHQRADLGRERVDRERERRVGAGAPGEFGDRLELAHRRRPSRSRRARRPCRDSSRRRPRRAPRPRRASATRPRRRRPRPAARDPSARSRAPRRWVVRSAVSLICLRICGAWTRANLDADQRLPQPQPAPRSAAAASTRCWAR